MEVDGLYFHNREKQIEKDRIHENYACLQGYRVVRFTDKEIKETKGKCFERLYKILRKSHPRLRKMGN